MQVTVEQIAALINGTVEGDPQVVISGPSKIEEGGEGTITFLANLKYEPHVYSTTASAVLVSNDFQPKQPINASLIRVADVYQAVAFLLEKFGQEQQPKDWAIHHLAFIHEGATIADQIAVDAFAVIEEGAQIGSGARIGAQVYIGKNVTIGEGAILYPGVKIYANCEIGPNSILHSNAVIGSDGFGFAPQEDGSYEKVAQIGKVVIEADVEIGANTVIDRATMGDTRIRRGAKLDNLIQIAHNVEIGEHTVMAAQAGVAGSTKIGSRAQIGGQAGFVGHIQVADGARIQAQSGIAAPIRKDGSAWYGSPAIPYSDYLRSYAVFKTLPDLRKKLMLLEQELARLKEEQTNKHP
jgi:UDP-3-O-[3-hydroxymyristoyl] glucosamine N-acyltransferase